MTGDTTSVPLRAADRWTAARMQQGRVLLDTDWNLNVDGPAREARQLATDTIGPAGVPAGSPAFKVTLSGGQLMVGAGGMWVDGLLAVNPAAAAVGAQELIGPLPTSGTHVVYLDAFVEEVQAAEDSELLDPALDGVDTTTRTRVGWRVRTLPAQSPVCGATPLPAGLGTGRLDVARTAAPVSPDPCAPPDDPRSKLPDGLLRIEVLDGGTEQTARFAWSYANGSDAVAAQVAGTAVTLAPSRSVSFAPADLVEVSWLARRQDRLDHGPLFPVDLVTPHPGGDEVTLGTASTLTGNPSGTCLRRWDGQSEGAAAPTPATLGGNDTGIAFTARPGTYLPGDWWGVQVRGSAADAVDELTDAPPDGTEHHLTPLAVVDLDAGLVVDDCRPEFPPLTELHTGTTCTVTAFPGDDLQAKADLLPATGGELCLAAGRFELPGPVTIVGKRRVTITGVGPSTVVASQTSEAVFVAQGCDDFTVTELRAEGGQPAGRPSPPGDSGLLGAITVLGGSNTRIHGCQVSCPDSSGRTQSGIYVAPDPKFGDPDVVEIEDNHLEIGDQQVGILVASAALTRIQDNLVRLLPGPPPGIIVRPNRLVARQLGRYIAGHLTDPAATRVSTSVQLKDGRTVAFGGTAPVKRLITDWAKNATGRRLASERTTKVALARWVASSAVEDHQAAIGTASANFIGRALRDARSMAQGIVVGGSRALRVRIEGNQVIGAIEGVHVGLQAPQADPLSAEQVVISDNTVESLIPFFWLRQRHAYYVGNVQSLTMVDNHAHLSRALVERSTPVEAVRVWGVLGPRIHIRGVDLTGPYAVGVRVRATTFAVNKIFLHYVSDVVNPSGFPSVDVPQTFIVERCIP